MYQRHHVLHLVTHFKKILFILISSFPISNFILKNRAIIKNTSFYKLKVCLTKTYKHKNGFKHVSLAVVFYGYTPSFLVIITRKGVTQNAAMSSTDSLYFIAVRLKSERCMQRYIPLIIIIDFFIVLPKTVKW